MHLTSIALFFATLPAIGQQPGETRFLPGDMDLVAAAGAQGNADVAFGNGVYLVVWEDDRATLAGTSESGGMVFVTDILAARVNQQGQLLDASPIVVDAGPFSQTRPHVAWNGSMWLVVWESERLTTFWKTRNVVAARIDGNGTLLDPVPIVVDDDDYTDEQPWDVASDGNDFAVVWQDLTGGSWTLDGATVDSLGTVSNKHVVYLPPNQFQAPWNTRLEWAGGRYLLAYDSTLGVNALLADATLQAVGTPIALGFGGKPQVARGAGGFYVTWGQGGTWGEVRGTPVSASGMVGVPNGTLLTPTMYPLDPHPAAAWDGSGWQVYFEAWTMATGWSMHASRVDVTGVLLQGPVVVATGGTAVNPVAENGAGKVFAAWTDGRNAAAGWGEKDIFGTTVDSNLTAGTQRPVSAGPPTQASLDLAGDSEQRLAVFVSAGDGQNRILAQRVDAFGVALDAQPIELAVGSPDLQDPAVSFDGTRYLVVWEDFHGSVFQSRIVGRRVARDGTILDSAPIDLMAGNNPDVAALGGEYLVVATHEPINHVRYCEAVRVQSSDGQVLGGVVSVGGNYARNASVAAFADRWMVVWQQNSTHDSPYASIGANTVLIGGSVGVAWFPLNSTAFEYDPDLAVSPRDDRGLLVWNDGEDLRGARIEANGTLVDSSAGFFVSNAGLQQIQPAVSWDGLDWTVAWTDYRGNLQLEPGTGDAYFGRVTPAGSLRDGDGMLLAADHELAEGNMAVSGARGVTALAWVEYAAASPYGTLRVRIAPLAPELVVGSVHRGQQAQLSVSSAQPGDVAYFLMGRFGRGPGVCVAGLGDLCVDLLQTPQLLGSATVGVAGNAALSVAVPATAPLVSVNLQAVLRRGIAGVDSSKTDVIGVTILP